MVILNEICLVFISAEAILYNHHCYKFISVPTTWNNAKAMCESFSSQLLTINTEEELAYLTTIASTFNPFLSPWTGMNDIAEEGHPVWLTKAQPLYNDFTDNDDPENRDCFYIDTDGEMGYRSCDDEFGYVCEASSIIYQSFYISERHKSPAAEHVVRRLLAVSSGACSLECSRLELCASFSFISSSNECILSTSTGQSSELDYVEDADFYVVTSTEEICRPFT
ncbi:alpha-N-acetylgalactosamine-specific lectin-like [Anneissia japonica]|uniref:alpha-N-acetylgalactosamine-specific lectin-like n=1 Tax=Anneissia japonica TaxID=1529436 RepID=UPI001425A869|nr:alpha-N-acetylgalactosamine-specific lectin-like [Anneissia japonica]